MKTSFSVTVALLGGVAIGSMLPTTRAQTSGGERAVWYFYRVEWGHQDEFVELYKKNHYPVLKEQMGSRLVDFKAYAPLHHGDGRADWTFATELVFKNDAEFMRDAGEDAIARRLFSDVDTFRAEERRRFEILDAHWDVPLREIPME